MYFTQYLFISIYELHPAFMVFILPISRNYFLITLGSKSKKEVYEVTVQNPIKIKVVTFWGE